MAWPRAALVCALLLLSATPVLAAGSWPTIENATIRPGVQVFSPAGQCTSNFVYTSPDNASLYLGLAAHCVSGEGERVRIRQSNGRDAFGAVAYQSWARGASHDFALIRIDDAHRGLVHPAMLHFGGPTGVGASQTVIAGEKVLSHGASGLRPFATGATSWKEGYVLGRGDPVTRIYTATPGIPGDSGSAVILGSGEALGTLITLYFVPPGQNGVTNLDTSLAYAAAHGVDVRLATWPLLDGGVLPPADAWAN